MNIPALNVNPQPVISSPLFGISDLVYRQAGWMVSENLTVLSNSMTAMSLYIVAVEYCGCCTHFFMWYVCALNPGSLRFTAPNRTFTGGFLVVIH